MDILSIVIGALYLLVAVIEVYAVIIAATVSQGPRDSHSA
jgi:hypothetical protein